MRSWLSRYAMHGSMKDLVNVAVSNVASSGKSAMTVRRTSASRWSLYLKTVSHTESYRGCMNWGEARATRREGGGPGTPCTLERGAG